MTRCPEDRDIAEPCVRPGGVMHAVGRTMDDDIVGQFTSRVGQSSVRIRVHHDEPAVVIGNLAHRAVRLDGRA